MGVCKYEKFLCSVDFCFFCFVLSNKLCSGIFIVRYLVLDWYLEGIFRN